MDDSQSSDVFCNSGDYSYYNSVNMDSMKYESLISNTKTSLARTVASEISKPTFSAHLCSLLENCDTCITQSLDLVNHMLTDTDLQLTKLQETIKDAVDLLQLLSSYIKNIVESVSMSCSTMKTFPTTTGRIIQTVFIHCKDSEILYGTILKDVENQLKDLFRSCHDLQLTYLMILGKHFIFDLTETEELSILIEVLDINLKIGDIVQTLDVKTMAEQWKAYTLICEKHSSYLIDKHIFQDCTKILCTIIELNIKSATEMNQHDKTVLRSLKVSNFTIKILLRISNIFKNTTAMKPDHVVELLLYIYLNNNAYLELTTDKLQQFGNLMNTHVVYPSDLLLRGLLTDETFVNFIIQLDINTLRNEDRLLGYIILIISITKTILQPNEDFRVPKRNLIECIYKILPYGHVWFNIGLKFNDEASNDIQTHGLYEHLLVHTLALAITLNAEQMTSLEEKMYEAILGTDYCSALFSSNLWVLLARYSTRQHITNQLVSLCRTYQKLETNKLFDLSPQQVYLSHTISRLFDAMPNDDKMRVYKLFSIHEDKNAVLLSVLKISNLPDPVQCNAEEIVIERLKTDFRKLFTSGNHKPEVFSSLSTTMKLAATCQCEDIVLRDNIMKAWTKVCTKNNKFTPLCQLDKGSMWFNDFIESLACLTNSWSNVFNCNANVVKIIHAIYSMMQKCSTELKLILINVVLTLSLSSTTYDENKCVADLLLVETFKYLFQETDSVVRYKFYNVLTQHRNKSTDNIISKVLVEDELLQDIWNKYICKNFNGHAIDLREQFMATIDFEYCHKCIENHHVIELSDSSVAMEKTNSKNFDFADIDTLFEIDSDSEPACKKVKLNVEDIISRLENDTALLSNLKENITICQFKNRIRNVCNNLRNIID